MDYIKKTHKKINKKKYLAVSFHDLAPHSETICEQFLEDLNKLGIEQISLLLVPDWHGEEPIERYPAFIRWARYLRKQGHEIVLHGYSHRADQIRGNWYSQAIGRYYTAGEGEFQTLDYPEAKDKITRGKQMFDAAELPVEGFIAPAWLLSKDARQAVRDDGFLYTTYLMEIEILDREKKTYAPTIVFSSRSGWRRWISLIWTRIWFFLNRNEEILRLAVHPIDLEYPMIRLSILSIARKALKSRTPVTYEEWVQQTTRNVTKELV